VLALSIVLLLIAFRSLLIPLQAVVTNLLCVGAAFGLLVATLQWGWGLHLVGLSTPYGSVPIASYVPLMMFAALFGLSMDYEVFLVSQVAQHHAAGAMVLSLAPAMLTLFGSATWWLPGWLARLLPHVDIEGETGPPPGREPAGEAAPGAAAMRAASRWRR